MRLKDIMAPNPECIRPDATLRDAATRMRGLDVGSMPVCGDDDRLAGMITDRDITIRAVAEGRDPKTSKVREAMTEDIAYGFEDQDTEEAAARLMEGRQIRRLVVLNGDQRLVGTVSLGDLATQGKEKQAGETLQAVSEPSQPRR